MGWWSEQGAKYKDLPAEYGGIALAVWFTIFGITMVGFYTAISMGFEVEGALGGAGKIGAAYAATQLTKPIRIFATLALTPIVARAKARLTGGEAAP